MRWTENVRTRTARFCEEGYEGEVAGVGGEGRWW